MKITVTVLLLAKSLAHHSSQTVSHNSCYQTRLPHFNTQLACEQTKKHIMHTYNHNGQGIIQSFIPVIADFIGYVWYYLALLIKQYNQWMMSKVETGDTTDQLSFWFSSSISCHSNATTFKNTHTKTHKIFPKLWPFKFQWKSALETKMLIAFKTFKDSHFFFFFKPPLYCHLTFECKSTLRTNSSFKMFKKQLF